MVQVGREALCLVYMEEGNYTGQVEQVEEMEQVPHGWGEMRWANGTR